MNQNCINTQKNILTFLIIYFILPIQSLKIHHQSYHNQQPVYDEQKYLVQISQRQNNFKQSILQIQNDFAGINLMLNDSNLNQNQKKIKLNQALADERDALIQAQTNLNIPYQLKSCQCLNLNQQRKTELINQLNKVTIKINDLETLSSQTVKKCQAQQCPLMNEITNQITMLKRYQFIMQQTIGSKCCKVIKYEYRDNLDANNWHFGNTTQSDYQAKIYQREQVSNIKLQSCPFAFPFVKTDVNQCFNCPNDNPLFNIGTRSCQKDCTQFSKNIQFILNMATHICGLTSDCPVGQYYDVTNKQCVTSTTNFNQSQCPPANPFWDPLSLSCQACHSNTPYFDQILKKCRSCNQNQKWDLYTRTCKVLSNVCNQGYYFNDLTKKCESVNINTHSLCPPQNPYWNELTFSCDSCGTEKPFYDPVKNSCRTCSDQETFNQIKKQCVPKTINPTCKTDEFYNDQTKTCDKKGTISMCPPSTPYWDSANFRCMRCPSDKPSFKDKTKQCEACAAGSIWSAIYNICIPQCIIEQEYNNDQKKCIKINKTCGQKQAFNLELNKCIAINCNETNPFLNVTNNKCQSCPPGTVYNFAINVCENNSKSGNISVCYEEKPVWNAEYLRCEACPAETSWNLSLKKCVRQTISNIHHHQHHISKIHHIELSQSIPRHLIQGQVSGNGFISYQNKQIHRKQQSQLL